MEQYPKPRHQYIYTPRYGQRGVLTYAGQHPNSAYPTGVMGGGYSVVGGVVGGAVSRNGYGMGYAGGAVAATACIPGVHIRSYYSPYAYSAGYGYGASFVPSYNFPYSGFHNSGLYGSTYPYANFYHPYQRSYYSSIPTYGYTQAYVYHPGPTTTTTTYHVTNTRAPAPTTSYQTSTANVVRETRPAYPPGYRPGSMRVDIQTENRRIATERGAYDARKIRPADARDDDPFWCREVNGEWHLRSYYQIENECHPGRWKMDAELGFLMFERL